MLELAVAAGSEMWDEEKEEFVYPENTVLRLEHSLVSISKWESRWHKPFLGKGEKTAEETMDYIRCMTLTRGVDPSVYGFLTRDAVELVSGYIGDPMTATWFSKAEDGPQSRDVVTSEVIYYWMVALGIPFTCERWHLNRLLTLIRVCNVKNAPPEKLSQREIAMRNSALNAARRSASRSKG